jgi:caa(3)-type oxidase subunit IV
MSTPPAKLSTYIYTYLGLVALATLSLLLSGLPEGLAITLSLAIAALKAAAVLLLFMHLIEEPFSYRFVMIVSTVLVCVLIALTVLDPVTRAPFAPPPNRNDSYVH